MKNIDYEIISVGIKKYFIKLILFYDKNVYKLSIEGLY